MTQKTKLAIGAMILVPVAYEIGFIVYIISQVFVSRTLVLLPLVPPAGFGTSFALHLIAVTWLLTLTVGYSAYVLKYKRAMVSLLGPAKHRRYHEAA